MTYLSNCIEDSVLLDDDCDEAIQATKIKAGYGECRVCPDGYCTAFVGSSYDDHCGFCRHQKEDHR